MRRRNMDDDFTSNLTAKNGQRRNAANQISLYLRTYLEVHFYTGSHKTITGNR